MNAAQHNRFVAGWIEGDAHASSGGGRALEGEDHDFAAGYVAGKYKQVLCRPIKSRAEAARIWSEK